jgi:hypothetical protein
VNSSPAFLPQLDIPVKTLLLFVALKWQPRMTFQQIWEVAGAIIVSVGGGGAVVFALSSWLGKVWANRILETDRAKYAREIEHLRSDLERSNRLLQGEIEKTIFVSKTHFETEFQILRDIWQKVSTVRGCMAQLRPITDIVDVRTTPEELLRERFEAFLPAVKELMDAVDHTSPFYPQEIFVTLDQLIQIAQRERDDIKLSQEDRLSFEGRRRGKANFNEYLAALERVSTLIRERLARLSIRKL